jgi:hypothetical protein
MPSPDRRPITLPGSTIALLDKIKAQLAGANDPDTISYNDAVLWALHKSGILGDALDKVNTADA